MESMGIDLAPQAALQELAAGVVASTGADGRTVGAVAGSTGVLCIDTPALHGVAGPPVRYLFLTHHHAAQDLGGAAVLVHAGAARRMTARPALSFADEVRVSLGDRDVVLGWVGRGHTEGDAVAWLPHERVLFAGGLVATVATPDCGEAHLAEWRSSTLARVAAFRADVLVPSRGPAVTGPAVADAIAATRAYLDALCLSVARTVARGGDRDAALAVARADLDPRFGDTAGFTPGLPDNVARAYDELQGLPPH